MEVARVIKNEISSAANVLGNRKPLVRITFGQLGLKSKKYNRLLEALSQTRFLREGLYKAFY